MSATVQFVILISVLGPALAYVLTKVIVPGAQLIIDTKQMIPFLRYLPILEDIQTVLPTIAMIAKEFTTDSGSTLKDDIVELKQHAQENRKAAAASLAAAAEYARTNRQSITELQGAMAAVKELARDDRQLAREDRQVILGAIDQLARVEASGARTEASGERVEASGVRTEAAAAHVADDLAAREKRADEVPPGEAPGTAADAAWQAADES